MRKSRIQVLAAAVFFTLSAFVLVAGYWLFSHLESTGKADNAVSATGPGTGAVVVAVRTIPRGSPVTADALGLLQLAAPPPAGSLTDPAQAAGKLARTDILPGQVVVADALADNAAGAGLAALVPPGLRAVAVRVNDEVAAGNHVMPGDIADLTVVLPAGALPSGGGNPLQGNTSEAHTLLQGVTILSVGDALSPANARDEKGNPHAVRDVTLAVTPEQASQLALVRSVATYYLALRNGTDRVPAADQTIRLADIRAEDARKDAPHAANSAARRPGRAGRLVEFLNGATVTHIRPDSRP